VSHEASIIHVQVSYESASGAFVSINGRPGSAVDLFEGFEPETRKPEPGCTYAGFLPDGKVKAPNREQVSRWAEVEIKVDAASHFGAFLAIEPPAPGRIDINLNPDRFIPDPS
jgi:hypothetical protein